MSTYSPTTIILGVAIFLSMAACTSSKENKVNLHSWLEQNYPGQYKVVDKVIDLNPKNLFYKKATSIVALQKDPDVQVKVVWHGDEPGLGIAADSFVSDMNEAVKDMALARQISGMMKQKLPNISIGVIRPAIYFIPFGDPQPATRRMHLDSILAVLDQLGAEDYTSIWIEWMEDSLKGKEFTDIIPNGYWYRGDSYHDRNKIMSLDFEYSPDIDREALAKGWKINPMSDRSSAFIETAYREAMAWSEKNLSKPFYLEQWQGVQFNLDAEDPMAIEYFFPIYEAKPAEDSPQTDELIRGYVTGKYHAEQNTFTGIKRVEDL